MYNSSVRRRSTQSFYAVVAYLSAGCLFTPGTASALDFSALTFSALDFNVQPRINAGMMYYQLEQEPNFAVLGPGGQDAACCISDFQVEDFLPFVGGGATLFVNRFFVDVYAQRAFSGDDEASLDSLRFFPDPPPDVFVVREISDQEFERDEYSLSFGYAVTDNFSLFAGYRRADTEFDESAINNAFFVNSVVPLQPVNLRIPRVLSFENDGPFVGGRYGWRIGDIGTIGLNLGIAFVEGEFTVAEPGQTREGGLTVTESPGETLGTTLGLSWTAPFFGFEGFNYVVGLDGYQYAFEADAENAPDFSETIIRASAGVSYLF